MNDQPSDEPSDGYFVPPPLVRAVHDDHANQVREAVAAGADPNEPCRGLTCLQMATLLGKPLADAALIECGARVPVDALEPLGEMDITDYLIDSPADEQAYAEVARILIQHGASVDVSAFDGSPLIETFADPFYSNIRSALLAGVRISAGEDSTIE